MRVLTLLVVVLLLAAPALAQDGAAQPQRWAYSGIALALAVALAALGQSRVAAAACEGMARNPSSRPGIQLALVLGLAFIESLVLFTWVMIFLRAPA